MSELSSRYAQALYEVCPDEPALRAAAGTLTASQALWEALNDPTVRPGEKKRVLSRVLDGTRDEVLHFLSLLCDKGRMDLLPGVLADFHTMALAGRNAAHCVMTCVHEPDEEQKGRLRELLCRLHHKSDVALEVRLDPDLIGGFTLDIEGVTYDRSVRGELRTLERHLEGRRSV